MARVVSDVLTIMRLAISRRNTNDPDSTSAKLLTYVNDFISLTMPNDVKLFEEFSTLTFNIDENTTDGVYTFNDVGATDDFINIGAEAFISILDPVDESTSWNSLEICRSPSRFFDSWGINNTDILVAGYPTEMLFYGNEMTFRTIPEQTYQVQIFGYKKREDFDDPSDEIPFDYWMRYLAYGAALDYADDYNFDEQKRAKIERSFRKQRKLLMTRTHNEILSLVTPPSF